MKKRQYEYFIIFMQIKYYCSHVDHARICTSIGMCVFTMVFNIFRTLTVMNILYEDMSKI